MYLVVEMDILSLFNVSMGALLVVLKAKTLNCQLILKNKKVRKELVHQGSSFIGFINGWRIQCLIKAYSAKLFHPC